MPAPALIYTRFSPRPTRKKKRAATTDVTGESTIEVQTDRCLAYCALAGLDAVAVLQERHISGTLPLADRPLGAELQRRLDAGEAAHVVVQKIDRLYRDVPDGVATLRAWQAAGITLHLADEGGNAINTSTAVGELLITQLLAIAQFYQRTTVERTRDNMAWRQAQGQRMGSVAPFGYRIDPDDPDRLVEDPHEQAAIARMRAIKQKRPQIGLRALGRLLTEEGFQCRGNGWHHNTIKKILAAA